MKNHEYFPDNIQREPTDVVLVIGWDGKYHTATAAQWFSDWQGMCEMCPENDTPITVSVFTADGKEVRSEIENADFEELMEMIRPCIIYHHYAGADEDYIRCDETESADEPKYFVGKKSAIRYIADHDVPYAKVVECIGICKECGHPVFPSREPGFYGYCHHCDLCYPHIDDLVNL